MQDGYFNKQFNQPTKKYCQTLELKNEPELIEEYKFWHKPENCWSEIPQGIKEVGILNMEIFIHGSKLFMIVETPLDFEWDKAFAILSTLNRQAEWEQFMAKFQLSKQSASSSEKWTLMDRIFNL